MKHLFANLHIIPETSRLQNRSFAIAQDDKFVCFMGEVRGRPDLWGCRNKFGMTGFFIEGIQKTNTAQLPHAWFYSSRQQISFGRKAGRTWWVCVLAGALANLAEAEMLSERSSGKV